MSSFRTFAWFVICRNQKMSASSKQKEVEASGQSGNFGAPATNTGWRNLLAFWVLGLCNNYGYVVMLTAAHDILKGGGEEVHQELNATTRTCNKVSAGAILLADIMPSVIIKLIAPFLPFFIHARMASVVLCSGAGFLLVSLSNGKQAIAVLGVIVTSLSSGLGEVTLLSYSHRYTKNVISTWSSGTGGAGIIGSLSYTVMRNTFKLTPEQSLMLMLVVPVVQAITFWLVLSHPEPTLAMVTDNGGVGSQEQIIKAPKMTLSQKFGLVPQLLKYMIPLGLVYLFEYFINQGLYELIDFKSMDHATQYHWLQTDYQIGVFISRSSVNFFSVNKIWIMAVLQLVNVLILTFETLYLYIPSIWIVFGLVLWEGLLGGAAYVNTFYKMSKEIPWEQREAALGIASMADSIGIALAGALAIPTHNAICSLPLPKRLGS